MKAWPSRSATMGTKSCPGTDGPRVDAGPVDVDVGPDQVSTEVDCEFSGGESHAWRSRDRLYSLGRCLNRECWRSSTEDRRPSTRCRAFRLAASCETALEAGWWSPSIGLTHDKRLVDARRVLVDIAAVDALASPDDLVHQSSRHRAGTPRRRPAHRCRRVPGAPRPLRRGRRRSRDTSRHCSVPYVGAGVLSSAICMDKGDRQGRAARRRSPRGGMAGGGPLRRGRPR